jgi:hypothetical protein
MTCRSWSYSCRYLLFIWAVLLPCLILGDRTRWENEIEASLKRNIKGCGFEFTEDTNQSMIAPVDKFLIKRYFPTKQDLQGLRHLPESITQSHEALKVNAIKRGYSYEKWGMEKESRWEIPATHPGQDKNNCLKMSFLAAEGKPLSFYNEFRQVDRAFYIAHASYALIHPSGATAISCGYYMGEECCENRWDYAKEWKDNCFKALKDKKLSFMSLFDDNLDSKTRAMVEDSCSDHRDIGLPNHAGLGPASVMHTLKRVKGTVFVLPALWDYNYHHWVADSLARLAHSIRFLRIHKHVRLHVRAFETYDGMHFRSDQFKQQAKLMRSRFLSLLGIDPHRVISGHVLADRVIVARCTRCSYGLSNPVELRLLRKHLLAMSDMKLYSWMNVGHNTNTSSVSDHHRRQLLPEDHPMYVPRTAHHGHVNTHQHARRHHNRSNHITSNHLLSVVLQQRYASVHDTDRDWTDATVELIAAALKQHLPPHRLTILSSKASKEPSYCLACDIKTYSGAHVLVGAHGAGLTNLLFLPPGSLVVEVAGEIKDVNMPVCGYYGPLASAVGAHHLLYVHNREPGGYLDPEQLAKQTSSFCLSYEHLVDQI